MPQAPKIHYIENHDYLSIRLPNGTFTISHSGEKGGGLLAKRGNPAFDRMCDFVKTFAGTRGEAMKALATEAKLTELWPEWAQPLPAIAVGDKVRVPDFARKFPGVYEVMQVKRTSAFVKLEDGSQMGFSLVDMVKEP